MSHKIRSLLPGFLFLESKGEAFEKLEINLKRSSRIRVYSFGRIDFCSPLLKKESPPRKLNPRHEMAESAVDMGNLNGIRAILTSIFFNMRHFFEFRREPKT